VSWVERVVGLTLAADAPAADTSQGPIVVVVLAVVTLLGTAATAAGPVLIEIAKNRGKTPALAGAGSGGGSSSPPTSPSPPAPAPASSQMAEAASSGLSMVEQAVLDYRAQRDAAQSRYDRVLATLAERDDIIRNQAVYIATLEGRLGVNQYPGQNYYPQQNRNQP
jgi:hypothetical protein